jgi:RNA recognition motif-containing protein
VSGVPVSATEDELQQAFEVFGAVRNVKFLQNRNDFHKKKAAYVDYKHGRGAAKAMQNATLIQVAGELVNVSFQERPGGPAT